MGSVLMNSVHHGLISAEEMSFTSDLLSAQSAETLRLGRNDHTLILLQ